MLLPEALALLRARGGGTLDGGARDAGPDLLPEGGGLLGGSAGHCFGTAHSSARADPALLGPGGRGAPLAAGIAGGGLGPAAGRGRPSRHDGKPLEPAGTRRAHLGQGKDLCGRQHPPPPRIGTGRRQPAPGRLPPPRPAGHALSGAERTDRGQHDPGQCLRAVRPAAPAERRRHDPHGRRPRHHAPGATAGGGGRGGEGRRAGASPLPRTARTRCSSAGARRVHRGARRLLDRLPERLLVASGRPAPAVAAALPARHADHGERRPVRAPGPSGPERSPAPRTAPGRSHRLPGLPDRRLPPPAHPGLAGQRNPGHARVQLRRTARGARRGNAGLGGIVLRAPRRSRRTGGSGRTAPTGLRRRRRLPPALPPGPRGRHLAVPAGGSRRSGGHLGGAVDATLHAPRPAFRRAHPLHRQRTRVRLLVRDGLRTGHAGRRLRLLGPTGPGSGTGGRSTSRSRTGASSGSPPT